jgi:hypothetical protein
MTTLITPVRPERCCGTCKHWTLRRRRAWCPVQRCELPSALTSAVCISYEREMQETSALELYQKLSEQV